jgi:hypothetical protein
MGIHSPIFKKYFRRSIALTNEHGSWVFLLSPLLIGLFASQNWSRDSLLITVAALSAFLIRQPITILVKVASRRRPQRDLPAAWFWIGVYGVMGLLTLVGLLMRGYGYLLYLTLPGIPVFIWHLSLVSRRSERRKMGIEIIASGVLALAAPAAYWIGVGGPQPAGWLLWGLTWLQSAASIVYAYLRLEQRVWDGKPTLKTLLERGWRANLYTSFNLGLVVILSLRGILPPWIFIPYLIQSAETLWGTINPAVGVKPTLIGIRQLIVSILYTILFIITW